MTFQTLISTEQLLQLRDQGTEHLVILDCQTDLLSPEQGYLAYCNGHIPQALHADLDQHGASAPGQQGRHPLPEPQLLVSPNAALGNSQP